MSIHSIGGSGLLGPAYQSLMRSLDRAADATTASTSNGATGSSATAGGAFDGSAGSASPGANLLSGANMIEAMSGGTEEVTGAVTATLPNGITLGVYSFAPIGSDQGAASSSSGSSASPSSGQDGSSAGSSRGPDYASMAAALEQMVDQFMNAASAYRQGSSDGSTQSGATGTVA